MIKKMLTESGFKSIEAEHYTTYWLANPDKYYTVALKNDIPDNDAEAVLNKIETEVQKEWPEFKMKQRTA